MPLTVPPAIWGRADGDVRLWVPFNGDSTADISAFNQTVTATSATIASGQFTVLTGASVQKLVYGSHASLALTASAWTLEAFITWTSSDNFISPGGELIYANNYNSYNYHVYANAGKVGLDTNDFGTPDAGPSATNVLSGTGKVHLAMVRPAGALAQTLRFYAAGAQQFTFTEAGTPGTMTAGTVTVGKTNGTGNAVLSIDDVRFTLRELYTGTSFTPPKSPL